MNMRRNIAITVLATVFALSSLSAEPVKISIFIQKNYETWMGKLKEWCIE